MKIWATDTYINSFEIEVDDTATAEEIVRAIAAADEYLGGNWYFNWEIIEEEEE